MDKSTDNIIGTSADVEQQDSHLDDKDGDEQRETWTNKREYLLSMIGNAVGLGNVWRFPYMCFKNGGGAFLISYFVMLMVIGIPMFFLESSIGQFTSQGPIKVWSAVPILQGVGVSMAVVMVMVSIYYNVIISYGLYYLFASFQYPLPWSTTEGCNLTGLPVTSRILENGTCPESASEQYWDLVALQRSSGLDETGPIIWHLALCLLLAWILIAAAVCKGIKSSGKVVYFTAIFPYVVLLILLIRGLTLEGAWDGIDYYIGSQSNMSKLGEAEDSHLDDKDGDEQRETWTNKREYLLSMIGNAVGLGNVWRFPYMCFKNGGGAFLISYFVMLMVIGIPMFFLESSIGQFTSQGPIKVWSAVPILQGVGVAMAVVMVMVSIYYNVIISYGLYYLFASFQYPLPWSTTEGCNLTGLPVTSRILENGTCPESASEQYWDLVALQRSSGLDETGPIIWHLALCLLLAWILIAAAVCKGIKSSGKVVYFTAIFPYVVLLILLIRGLTLEGAWDGIDYYIGSQSNMSKLGEAEVWKDAATQVLNSLAAASGPNICLSSYNKFHNKVFRDTVVVTLADSGTSVFAGFAIFSILGHIARVSGKHVSEVANAGFGLAFIAYPDALATLPVSPLWSILFFLMLVTLGLGSQFGGIETLMTCVADAYPKFFKSKRLLITVVTCTVLFLLGLPCVTRAGIYWVTLIDTFVTSWVLLITGFFEFIAFIHIYGVNRLIEDIEMMIGKKSFCFWLWWRICWFVITPCIILVILIWSLATFVAPTYGDVEFPAWGLALGWCMALFCILWIPLIAVYKLMRAEGNLWQRVKCLSSPSKDWHPYLDVHRGERYSEHSRLGMNTSSAPEPNAEDTRL